MKVKNLSAVASFLLLVLLACMIHAQEAQVKPVIDPEADAILRQLSEQNKQIQKAIIRLTDTIDDVQADGRKFQFAHVRELTIARPNKLKVETIGDVTNRTLWLDGKMLTVLDKNKNVYAQLADPGSIEQAIDTLQNKYNMSLPGADLLTSDIHKTLTEGCSEINYLGIGYVGEEKCHHLAFTRGDIDWQMWIATGDKPSTRKMVITYTQLPGQPQYTLQLLKFELGDKIKDSVFNCELPQEAKKIEFQPRANQQ